LAARTPVAVALLDNFRLSRGVTRGLGRLPEASARKPFHHDVFVRALKLCERRQQVFAELRAERGRGVVDQNRPVCEARRHFLIL
jgi:hypothetical protein